MHLQTIIFPPFSVFRGCNVVVVVIGNLIYGCTGVPNAQLSVFVYAGYQNAIIAL